MNFFINFGRWIKTGDRGKDFTSKALLPPPARINNLRGYFDIQIWKGWLFLPRSLFWSWFRFHSSHDHKKGKVWRNTRKRAGAPNSCQDQLQLSSWWWWWRWWWWLSGRLEPLSGPIKTLSRVIVVVVVVMLNFNSNASIYPKYNGSFSLEETWSWWEDLISQ